LPLKGSDGPKVRANNLKQTNYDKNTDDEAKPKKRAERGRISHDEKYRKKTPPDGRNSHESSANPLVFERGAKTSTRRLKQDRHLN
jgi:hypothetical protein